MRHTSHRGTAIRSFELGELAARAESFPRRSRPIVPPADRAARPRRWRPRRRKDVGVRILHPGSRSSGYTFKQTLFRLSELLCGSTAIAGGMRSASAIGQIAHRPRHVVRKRARRRIAVIAVAAVLVNVSGRRWRQSVQTDTAETVARSAAIVACRTRVAALAAGASKVRSKAVSGRRGISRAGARVGGRVER